MDEAGKLVLMRLVDGELTAEEAAAATASCREQPEAAARLAALVGDRALLQAAFPPEASDAARLVAAIDAAFASARRRPNRFLSRAALPIAASVLTALLVGTGGVMLADRQAEDTAARVVAALGRDRQLTAAAFGEALDKQLSGQSVEWSNPDTGSSGSVTPLRTFRASDGRWCREYEQRVAGPAGAERLTGIACRDAQGWRPKLERPGEA
jgi:surface antigen